MAVSVLRRIRLFSGTLSTTANTVAYTAGTAPTDGFAKVSFRFTVCNRTSTAANLFVGVDNGSGLQAYLYNTYSVPGNDTLIHDMTVDLMGGEKLQAWAGTASALDLSVTGIVASDT